MPAALFMALSRTMIRTAGLSGRAPAAALLRANQLILNDSRAEMFLTAFYAELDTRSGRLAYARAGHNRPLWWQAATGELDDLAGEGIVLALSRRSNWKSARSIWRPVTWFYSTRTA